MTSAYVKYVEPREDGTHVVYDNSGNVAVVTKDKAYAVSLAKRFEREANR